MSERNIDEKAEGITRLFRERRQIDILPLELMPADLDEAYRVRQIFEEIETKARGTVAGYKIGLTTPIMQQLCGVDEPVYGAISRRRCTMAALSSRPEIIAGLASRRRSHCASVKTCTGWYRRILARPRPGAVESCMAAIELLEDLRHDYKRLSAAAMVAGNVWNAGIIVGAPVERLARARPRATEREAVDQWARSRYWQGRRCHTTYLNRLAYCSSSSRARNWRRRGRGGDRGAGGVRADAIPLRWRARHCRSRGPRQRRARCELISGCCSCAAVDATQLTRGCNSARA